MTICYREIKDVEDKLNLQREIDRFGNLVRKWGMRSQPVKSNMLQLIRKEGTLEGTDLENVESKKYAKIRN